MSNQLYNGGREGFLAGEIDWDGGTIRIALVRSYTFAASHRFVSDVTGAGGVLHVTSDPLTGKTVTGGTADADDVTFTAVAANASGHSILVFQSSAPSGGADLADTEQRLIAWIDTGTNLPIVPNGGDVSIAWDNGADKIFTL